MIRVLLCLCLVEMLAAGCAQQPQQPPPPPDTRAADEAAIKSTEVNWGKAANPDEFVSFYADDATVLPPNSPTITGKDAAKKLFAGMMAMPGFSLSLQGTKVEVAKSGDIGYTHGTYEMTMNDPKGKPMKDTGKFLTVWKKQGADWKAVEDMFSSDLPAPK